MEINALIFLNINAVFLRNLWKYPAESEGFSENVLLPLIEIN